MIELVDPNLGALQLRADPFVVVSFEISAAVPRPVMRDRALMDGGFDDTAYVGGRTMTLSLRLKDDRCSGPSMQSLYDLLMPYTSVRRRMMVRWSLPGSDSDVRQMMCRGDGAPVYVEAPRHPAIIATFVSADGEITSGTGGPDGDGLRCRLIDPSGDVEAGRTYDLTFDRTYPPSSGIGDRTITTNGNANAHWVATIFGPTEDPFLRVNGLQVQFTDLDLLDGQSLVIDTRERTMLLNGDPEHPRSHLSNFADWQWADLMLRPHENRVRYGAAVLGVGSVAQFCWRDTWAG